MFGGLGMFEMAIIAVLAVVLFGSKLPQMMRSIGKSYGQFRKGLSDIQADLDEATREGEEEYERSKSRGFVEEYEDRDVATAPKFVPPPAEPQTASDSSRGGQAGEAGAASVEKSPSGSA